MHGTYIENKDVDHNPHSTNICSQTTPSTPKKIYYKWKNVVYCCLCGSTSNADRFIDPDRTRFTKVIFLSLRFHYHYTAKNHVLIFKK